jgi:Double zinc ribbon
MPTAIFGIESNGLNLVVSLLLLTLVVVWLALVVYTYLDAKRRIRDPFLIACATIASFFPYVGTMVYAIVRPPEFLEDAHERELEIRAAELRVRQLSEASCPKCGYPTERSYLRCPQCQRRLKDPCQSCGKPVDPRWALCPYCEAPLPEREWRPRRKADAARKQAPPRQPAPPTRRKATSSTKKEPATRAPSEEAATAQRPQRSESREPDTDPRQA